MGLLNFGGVIRYREAEYVYLAATDEQVFLAKMLTVLQTEDLQTRYDALATSGTPHARRCLESVVYCFVTLNTKDFEGRAAHLAKTDYDFDPSFERLITALGELSQADKQGILQEILRDGTAVPKRLKEIMGALSLG